MGKTRRNGNMCCVPGCRVNDDITNIKFYRFSVRSYNLEKRAKWIKAIKRVNADGSSWQPSSRSRICSQHFVGGEKSEHPHSPAYLPTIFPEKYYGKQKNTETAQLKAQNRFARIMRRRLNQNENTKLTNTKKWNIQNDSIDNKKKMSESNIEIKIEPEEERAEAVLLTNFTKTYVFNVKEELKELEGLSDVYVEDSIWLNDVKVELPRVKTETDCNNSDYLGNNENVECETEIIPDIKVKEEFAQIEFISLPNIQYESNDYFNCKVKKETTELELKQKTSTESVYQQPKLTNLKCTVNLQRQEYSNVTYFVCEYCQKLFQKKTNLQDHLITHQKISLTEVDYINEPLKCDKCGYITSQKDIMNTHMKLHNLDDTPKYYECEVCKYRTLQKSTLENHQRVHIGLSPFKCYICGHVAFNKFHLNAHMKTHTEKIYECNVCNFKTVYKNYLVEHQHIHTGQSPYKCNICDFSTRFSANITLHRRSHIDEFPYKCNQCGYSGDKKSALKIHMKMHSKQQKYLCDVCDFKTSSKIHFSKHKRDHIDKHPYKCYQCKYSTNGKKKLIAHMRTHRVERTFKST